MKNNNIIELQKQLKMERDIDSMKYRKSTHLAGIDVESIIGEKGDCILTIKDAYYAKGVNVSGNKTDGYFLEFLEDVKGMVVNSTNRKTIASIVKINKSCTSLESRNIGNWIGTKIELIFDDTIKMMNKITGGIRVAPKSPIPDIDDKNALEILKPSSSMEELKANWSCLTKQEQMLPTVNAFKEQLKSKL